MKKTQNINFLRHGQTDGNVKKLLYGTLDLPLNENGIEQAHKIGKLLAKEEVNRIYTSPLKRALQTANIVLEYINAPLTIVDELQEMSFGSLEGEVVENALSFLNDWRADKIDEKYKVEKFSALKDRINRGMQKIEQKDDYILIVSHGMFYYAFCEVYNLEYCDIANCQLISHKITF